MALRIGETMVVDPALRMWQSKERKKIGVGRRQRQIVGPKPCYCCEAVVLVLQALMVIAAAARASEVWKGPLADRMAIYIHLLTGRQSFLPSTEAVVVGAAFGRNLAQSSLGPNSIVIRQYCRMWWTTTVQDQRTKADAERKDWKCVGRSIGVPGRSGRGLFPPLKIENHIWTKPHQAPEKWSRRSVTPKRRMESLGLTQHWNQVGTHQNLQQENHRHRVPRPIMQKRRQAGWPCHPGLFPWLHQSCPAAQSLGHLLIP